MAAQDDVSTGAHSQLRLPVTRSVAAEVLPLHFQFALCRTRQYVHVALQYHTALISEALLLHCTGRARCTFGTAMHARRCATALQCRGAEADTAAATEGMIATAVGSGRWLRILAIQKLRYDLRCILTVHRCPVHAARASACQCSVRALALYPSATVPVLATVGWLPAVPHCV
jgi:hypothetical protein